MIYPTPSEVDHLARVYLVANTPAYLYRHFRADPGVQRLAELNHPRDLVDSIVRVDQAAERGVRDVVAAYAFTVALTIQDSRQVLEALQGLDVANLNWAGKILRLWEQSRIATEELSISLRPKIMEPSPMTDVSESRIQIDLVGGHE